MTRRGTGEEREEGGGQVREQGGGAQRRKHGGNNTTDRGKQREEHKRHLKDAVGHGRLKHKTQQDTIQRHGNQIQETTRQNQTQEHDTKNKNQES